MPTYEGWTPAEVRADISTRVELGQLDPDEAIRVINSMDEALNWADVRDGAPAEALPRETGYEMHEHMLGRAAMRSMDFDAVDAYEALGEYYD